MNKKLQDYLHLYLGCEMKHQSFQANVILKGVTITGFSVGFKDDDARFNTLHENCKLLLRPLSDMRAAELLEVESMLPVDEAIEEEDVIKMLGQSAECTRWLLAKSFDLFGLIESGLALDKTKHK